jgi:hypothetical protein
MTIDIEKMKALVLGLRHMELNPCSEAATAIESLLSELEAREADRRDAERYREDIRYEYEHQYVPAAKRRHIVPCTLEQYKDSADKVADVCISERQEREGACWCETCRPITMDDMRMILCPTCGNKRCPHATDHRNACTGSNEPGQPGSSYEHCRRTPASEGEQK